MTAKKILQTTAAGLLLAAMVFFLSSPARYGKCVLDGVSLWAVSVLPATFPFLFLTALFTRLPLFGKAAEKISPVMGKVFRVSGTGGCAALLAALSGYPVGARGVLDLYESRRIDSSESFRLACLATTTGPMFLVGAVGGGMMGRPALGWLLLLCHFLAVWIVCFVLRFIGKPVKQAPVLYRAPQGDALYESLYSSVISILCVGGSIALFYAFGQMVTDILPAMPPASTALVRGLLEMTAGCKLFSENVTPLSLAGCSFLVTFGGLCVLCQQIAFLSRAEVKTAPFLLVKLLQGLLAGVFSYGLAWMVL